MRVFGGLLAVGIAVLRFIGRVLNIVALTKCDFASPYMSIKLNNTRKCKIVIKKIREYLDLISYSYENKLPEEVLANCLTAPFYSMAYRAKCKELCDLCVTCKYHDAKKGKFANGWCLHKTIKVPELPMNAKPDCFVINY
jgi:hypothetical protein